MDVSNINDCMDIKGFSGKYRFLSNFYASKVLFDDLEYNTVEAAYQAAKTEDLSARRRIREAEKPGDCKRLGQRVKLRENWEQDKLKVMEELVRQKFKDADLREKLLATGDSYLEETNHWGDTFWGVCKAHGTNHLGKILMKVREEIRHPQPTGD